MIKYYNRKDKTHEVEKVAGEKYLNWLYSSPVGKNILELLVKKKGFSKIYGTYCDTKFSAKKIRGFIEDLGIDMNKYEKEISDFKSFNEFFIRELKPEHINFSTNPKDLISPCDGRLLVYENLSFKENLEIKGFNYSLDELLKDREIASEYEDGTSLVFRLCPTDYHRFHFIDDGICRETKKIKGMYYSVNPISLDNIKKVFVENKREWSILESENFGSIIYMEVGATCVGSIIQSYKENSKVNRGSEKGYFKFGGSTVVLLFKKDTIKIHEDIISQSTQNIETLVSMGETIGKGL
ncbi:phosphatidylserine decarboxylase [Hathewaya histolytica]|uniref:Phosphatidylserine decarboxylase proenzyme n=1 Tax=Hathewaya histolytica TaxID=1498 RepID=A0A4U9QVU8_HATHI|nr:phosphatidylserine decarboxylase [Hathewaya histolytica]VTQ81603.1 phosphatidylserine decarboxylase [Hathewaya histolytica]